MPSNKQKLIVAKVTGLISSLFNTASFWDAFIHPTAAATMLVLWFSKCLPLNHLLCVKFITVVMISRMHIMALEHDQQLRKLDWMTVLHNMFKIAGKKHSNTPTFHWLIARGCALVLHPSLVKPYYSYWLDKTFHEIVLADALYTICNGFKINECIVHWLKNFCLLTL